MLRELVSGLANIKVSNSIAKQLLFKGDQGLPGETGAPGERGLGEPGAKV